MFGGPSVENRTDSPPGRSVLCPKHNENCPQRREAAKKRFMPELNIYRSGADVPRPLYYQAQAFSRIVFGDIEDYDIDLELHEPGMHVVVSEGNLLISWATIVWRDIHHAGQSYTCFGLSGVLTFPAFRNRGYGGQVVKTATDLIRADARADIALLWTARHNANFYARFGWQVMPAMTTLIGSPDAPEVYDDELTMMLFVSEKGQSGMTDFEQGRVYIGEEEW